MLFSLDVLSPFLFGITLFDSSPSLCFAYLDCSSSRRFTPRYSHTIFYLLFIILSHSIGALCPQSWWIAFFFRFSSLKRSYYLGMVRRAADHCKRVPWAASWVQSGVEWATTRASWPVFGNKGENNRRTTRLSHYGPQIIYLPTEQKTASGRQK